MLGFFSTTNLLVDASARETPQSLSVKLPECSIFCATQRIFRDPWPCEVLLGRPAGAFQFQDLVHQLVLRSRAI